MNIELKYELLHREQIDQATIEMSRMLKINADRVGKEIAKLQAKRELQPNKYGAQLKRNKRLLNQIDTMFAELENSVYNRMNELSLEQWNLANEKNTALVKSFLGYVKKKYNVLNLDAYEAFKKRNVNGLNLSERIHNLTELNKQLYIDYMGSGITQGKSAISIAKELNSINADPYNVTVYDAKGNPTKLAKISPILKPDAKGRGIYRSPLKNLYRVTRTETNAAYRLSDMERIQQLDFIVGYKVNLSKSHKITDMCDYLKGDYPKGFVFSGWHPQCFCYVTTILKTREEFRNDKPGNPVKDVPDSAKKYVAENDMSKYDWHKLNYAKT